MNNVQNVDDIPAMTPPEVHEYLREIGREWSGKGLAVECGCWLGATTAALGQGLADAGYEGDIICFDRWKANGEEVGKAETQGVDLRVNQNLQPVFEAFVRQACPFIGFHAVRGEIRNMQWPNKDKIEIFLLDAVKQDPGFTTVMNTFGPAFVEGATIGLMDFYYARKIGRRRDQERWAEKHSENLTLIKEFDGASCAFFRYEGNIW